MQARARGARVNDLYIYVAFDLQIAPQRVEGFFGRCVHGVIGTREGMGDGADEYEFSIGFFQVWNEGMCQAQGGHEVDCYDFSNAFRALLCDGAKISGASILNRQIYGVNFLRVQKFTYPICTIVLR